MNKIIQSMAILLFALFSTVSTFASDLNAGFEPNPAESFYQINNGKPLKKVMHEVCRAEQYYYKTCADGSIVVCGQTIVGYWCENGQPFNVSTVNNCDDPGVCPLFYA